MVPQHVRVALDADLARPVGPVQGVRQLVQEVRFIGVVVVDDVLPIDQGWWYGVPILSTMTRAPELRASNKRKSPSQPVGLHVTTTLARRIVER